MKKQIDAVVAPRETRRKHAKPANAKKAKDAHALTRGPKSIRRREVLEDRGGSADGKRPSAKERHMALSLSLPNLGATKKRASTS